MLKVMFIIAIASVLVLATIIGLYGQAGDGGPVTCGSAIVPRAQTQATIQAFRSLGCNQFVVTDQPPANSSLPVLVESYVTP